MVSRGRYLCRTRAPLSALGTLSRLVSDFVTAVSLFFPVPSLIFFFNDTATTEIYTLSLHDALPIWNSTSLTPFAKRTPVRPSLSHFGPERSAPFVVNRGGLAVRSHTLESGLAAAVFSKRSEEHTSELQSLTNLVCRLLLEKKKQRPIVQIMTNIVYMFSAQRKQS